MQGPATESIKYWEIFPFSDLITYFVNRIQSTRSVNSKFADQDGIGSYWGDSMGRFGRLFCFDSLDWKICEDVAERQTSFRKGEPRCGERPHFIDYPSGLFGLPDDDYEIRDSVLLRTLVLGNPKHGVHVDVRHCRVAQRRAGITTMMKGELEMGPGANRTSGTTAYWIPAA